MCNEHNLNNGNKIITNMNSSLLKHESNRKAILINGLPASGKSFLGRKLAYQYNAPLLTLDTIKEAMFDTLGIGDREYNRSLSKASKEIIWALIAEFPKDSLVSWMPGLGFQLLTRSTMVLNTPVSVILLNCGAMHPDTSWKNATWTELISATKDIPEVSMLPS